jgi:hypothetical protein
LGVEGALVGGALRSPGEVEQPTSEPSTSIPRDAAHRIDPVIDSMIGLH